MQNLLKRFIKQDDGSTAIEYALIAGALVLGIIASVQSIGNTVSESFSSVNSGLESG